MIIGPRHEVLLANLTVNKRISIKGLKVLAQISLTSKENIPATLSGDSQFLSSETTFSLDEMLEIITDDNWDESWLDCVAQHYPERLEAEIKAMKNMEKPI